MSNTPERFVDFYLTENLPEVGHMLLVLGGITGASSPRPRRLAFHSEVWLVRDQPEELRIPLHGEYMESSKYPPTTLALGTANLSRGKKLIDNHLSERGYSITDRVSLAAANFTLRPLNEKDAAEFYSWGGLKESFAPLLDSDHGAIYPIGDKINSFYYEPEWGEPI